MTPAQQLVLDLIRKLNTEEFDEGFEVSSVMAFVQVESAFRPRAYRLEPSGVASYGLMQVLDVTAKPYGIDDPRDMFDPETSLRVGMHVAWDYWDVLAKHFGRDPTREEWCASYNEGPGNVMRGRPDEGYVRVWMAAKAYWKPLVDGGGQ